MMTVQEICSRFKPIATKTFSHN